MKSIRNLVLLAVVMMLAWSVMGVTAFGQTFTAAPIPKDTINNAATNVRLLLGTFSGLAAGDSLISVKLKSCTQKEFAISQIQIKKKTGATETTFGTYNINGRFDENFEVIVTGSGTPFANGDSMFVLISAWEDSIDTDTTYHETGLELVIPQYGIKFRNAGVIDSTFTSLPTGPNVTNPGAFRTSFDPDACNPNPTGQYTRIFDLYAPVYDVSIAILDSSCNSFININDRLVITVSDPNEQIKDSAIFVNLSAFGLSANYRLRTDTANGHYYNGGTVDPTDDVWIDTVKVAADNMDVISGHIIYFSAQDNAGNTGTVPFQFNRPIDTIAPRFDSLRFFISENNTGSDTSAAIGDQLSIIAYMTTNGFFEIDSVATYRYIPALAPPAMNGARNFRTDTTYWNLDDVTNGNGIWRLDFYLTDEMARDIASGTNIDKFIYLTAWDNACNVALDSISLQNALDLDPPQFSAIEYQTVLNADSSDCTNLGDSLRVEADLSGSSDIATVYSNFLDGGLGGATQEALGSLGSGLWALRWKIGQLMDPNFDPISIDAKDANSPAVDADFTVWVYATDDAGNLDSLQSSPLLGVLGGNVNLDTRRPVAIDQDAVSIHQLAGGKIRLTWPVTAQAQDAQYFYVYVDSTGDGFDYDNVFGTTFTGEYLNAGPDSNAWTSEVLTHAANYKFVVRTEDDCGNFEFNTNIFEGTPDAQAPIACVVFPAVNLNFGPGNLLMITATTPDADIALAGAVWRKQDRGDGTPGAWQNYSAPSPVSYMSDFGQTFRDTINLGTDPSTEGIWELLILTEDSIGNMLTLAEAEAACGMFEFYWNPNVPVCDFLTINGAFAPQTACGFEVDRTTLNTAVVTAANADAGPYYMVDTWVIFTDSLERTRVDFMDEAELPYEYQFWVGDWPKTIGGPLPTYLITEITDIRNGATCVDSVRLCLPDEVAPKAFISDPVGYQCVQLAQSSLNSVEIRVDIDPTGYDNTSPIRAEFFYSLDGSTPGVKIGESAFQEPLDKAVAAPLNPFAVIDWDNSELTEGYVWLYAVIYDDVNNAYTTPFVKVCLDGTMPEMVLSVKDGDIYAGCDDEPKWRVGSANDYEVTLSAELVNFVDIDIAEVKFFYQPVGVDDVIDVYYWWTEIGNGMPANNTGIWTINFDYDDLDCGYDYRIRVAVKDNAGNWMLDMDGDGFFDDYTFDDALAAGSGMIMYFDCGPVQPSISSFATAGGAQDMNWLNPSQLLGGSGQVFAEPNDDLTVQAMTLPAADSCEVAKVTWYCNDIAVGSSTNSANWWEVTFNATELGLLQNGEVHDGYIVCTLTAVMEDMLGQTDQDQIVIYFLDVIPPNALILNPGEGEYVCGDVALALAPIHAEQLQKVVWYYWPAAGGPAVMIDEVFANEVLMPVGDEYFYWNATWSTLNSVPDGDYYVGASLCDWSNNFTDMEQTKVMVHVRNAIPTVTITEPTSGFFCGGEYFCAEVNVNGGAPIANVQFQWKNALDDNGEWENFENGPDREAPWCATFEDEDFFDDADEGFYQFRAVVTSECERYSYSNIVTLFYDDTAPLARGVSVTDGSTIWDIENANDPTPSFAQGTQKITWTFRAQDNQSPWGPSPIYNSGISSICAEDVCTDIVPDANGYFTVDWDMSGIPAGQWTWGFTVYDAVGCNATQFSVDFVIYEGEPTIGLVAGCWRGELFGIAEYDANTMFQQRQNGGSWVAIGGSSVQDNSWLLQDDWSYTPERWGVYKTPWSPANGTYEVRLLSDNGYGWEEELAPITTIVVSDEGCAVSGVPANYGPGSIERNLENGCDNLEGLATISSTFGMPYGLAAAYNVATESWSFDLIAFTALNQQGGINRYSGAFHFDALVDDGFGEGRVFFVDFADLAAWSIVNDYQTFWVTRDYGTGGPVTFMDVTVDIPAEFTDNTGHDYNALAIWKSKIARASVWQDWLFTPVGDNNGMMTYLSDPSCNDICGDDAQYAIVKMQYNNSVNIPAESLMVAWWDGEGTWRTSNVYFPSTVRGFYEQGGQNWVEFAVTCFGDGDYEDAWYSVVKRTAYDGTTAIRRTELYPYCGIYTGGYPEFTYQTVEAFQNTIDWSTLEVYLNGVRIQDRDGYSAPDSQTTAKHITGAKTALDEADNVDIWVDEVSGQIHVWFYAYYYYDDDDNYYSYSPLPCGQHELYVRVEDSQNRPQSIRDNFMVDCADPDVDFDNSYVSKNPTLTFTIEDAHSGVNWSSVHVDIFFVTKGDTTAGGPDGGSPKERAVFMQTFFPAQIEDYLQADGKTVIIPTTYDLDDERGLIAVIYDGSYSSFYDDEYNYYYGDPGAYDNFDRYYRVSGGVEDCVGNYTTPHVQYFTVDYDGATITMTSNPNACPLVFAIDEDGSGVDNIEIRENGVLLGAAQGSIGAVDEEGEWYFASSSNGGTLYYCPSNGASYVISVTDNSGGTSTFAGTKGGTLADGSVGGWVGPNPFDPATDEAVYINVGLSQSANVVVSIYDYSGRVVKTINAGNLGAGESAIAWDGRTDQGTVVADGAYMARIEASGSFGSSASAVVWIAVVEK